MPLRFTAVVPGLVLLHAPVLDASFVPAVALVPVNALGPARGPILVLVLALVPGPVFPLVPPLPLRSALPLALGRALCLQLWLPIPGLTLALMPELLWAPMMVSVLSCYPSTMSMFERNVLLN